MRVFIYVFIELFGILLYDGLPILGNVKCDFCKLHSFARPTGGSLQTVPLL